MSYRASSGSALPAFFAEHAVYSVRHPDARVYLEGRDAIADWFAIGSEGDPELLAGSPQFFLSQVGAVEFVPDVGGVGEYRPGEKHLTNVYSYGFSDGLIESFELEFLSSWLRTAGGMRANHAAALESLYEEYIAAWNSGDAGRIERVYAATAERVDGLVGGSLVLGEDWGAGVAAYLRPGAVGVSYEPVVQSFAPHDDHVNLAVFTVSGFDEPTHAHVIFDLRTAEACPLRIVARWELDGFLIAGEELFYGLNSARRCGSVFGLGAFPSGWWTGLEPPSPFLEEITATVATEEAAIVVVNGNERQVELLRWALDRFLEADLRLPRVDLVAFPPNAECASINASGLARFDVNAAHIFMCLEPADICNGPTCDQFQLRARASLLHELGHLWEFQNVDAETRRSFLEIRDLDIWSDSESGWAPEGEGIEHAAEILSWGLMDEPMELIRIPDTGQADLTAAFQLLTGRAPLGGRSTK